MTEKLYDYDAYAVKFEAKVLECIQEKDLYKVILDKTLFFPEEGGQSPDKGTLNGNEVLDVRIKDDVITHYLRKPFCMGETVKGEIDWEHRFSNMQLHSGEHILSGIVFSKYGYNNVGFHLSDNTATMDYDGKFTYEEALELEKMANSVIFANKKITAEYPSPEKLKEINYRSKKELLGPVRIVTVEDTDVCACCAPHVHLTGEIGLFKIIGFENYKAGVRITYLCGYRALAYFNECIESLSAISKVLSCKRGSEKEKVLELSDENKRLNFEFVASLQKNISTRIKNEFSGKENGLLVLNDNEAAQIRYAATEMSKAYKKVTCVLSGNDDNGYRFLIETSEGDLLEIQGILREKYNAKCGGKPQSIQGSVKLKLDNFKELLKL